MRLFSGICPLLLLLLILSGCAYVEAGAYKSVDSAVLYCEYNSDASRNLIRTTLDAPALEKDVSVCLRCPGDIKTYCVGDPKLIVPQ